MNFNKGDQVIINPKSQYYGESPKEQLPEGVIGIITDVSRSNKYVDVHWYYEDIEHSNSYRVKDLLPYKKLIHPLLLNKKKCL